MYYDYYFFAACFFISPLKFTLSLVRRGFVILHKIKKRAPFEAARVEEVALIMMALNFVIPCAHTNSISTWLNFAAANAGETFDWTTARLKMRPSAADSGGRNNFCAAAKPPQPKTYTPS